MEEVVSSEDMKGFEGVEVWKCQRLVMADHVRRTVFPHTRLWAHADANKISIESSSNTLGGDPHEEALLGGWQTEPAAEAEGNGKQQKERERRVSCRVDISQVELLLYPLGNGLLLFHLDWKPDPTCPLALDQLRSWLYMAKFKHKVRGIFYGWTLGQEDAQKPSGAYASAHLDSLGKLAHPMHVPLGPAPLLYEGSFASLSCIGNWLVHLPHENSLHPPRRISYSAPTKRDLRDYLRHLTRAFNVSSMTPDVLLPEAMNHHTLEKILPHRRNRYLGVSVEGNVSFSWLTEDSNPLFECVTWPKVYQGIYLLLDVHTRGEGSVLSELSHMSAKVAEHLHLSTFDKLEKDRLRLRSVAMQMIKYSLGMSSDVCSGMSEYAQYFTTLRKVLSIPSGKQKIREEIEHVLNIVESVYMEEQRRKKHEEKKNSKERELARRKIESMKEARRQRFETLISIAGTVTLPLVLVGGLMGMNLDDLPSVGFWPLMGYSALASFILFLLLMLWYSKVHNFIFRRFWARDVAVLRHHHQLPTEVEEDYEDEDEDVDHYYYNNYNNNTNYHNSHNNHYHNVDNHSSSSSSSYGGRQNTGGDPSLGDPRAHAAAAESDTTPLLYRG
ncbi:uncharacterized protein ACA1_177080 [Acanthamoeba castellanii str. Neff]|uniref:Uncharacterized protein n=1 Tax=Acanthamoeba castellanii (strain ATCC 30010 / Neff) TaxID=1257118 RepID=L8GT19_ACACF|nr:uncharacterized protein ACA1_177080 [Acanthamoeba castellanii str. Neff]ELR16120.1 hypothetical protein ACA1_177080 [Acanthamoeba castellanii str. Neff]